MGEDPPYGSSPQPVPTWLPQPDDWARYCVTAQQADEDSMLLLYRTALRIRREHEALGEVDLRWLDAPAGCSAFARETGFRAHGE